MTVIVRLPALPADPEPGGGDAVSAHAAPRGTTSTATEAATDATAATIATRITAAAATTATATAETAVATVANAGAAAASRPRAARRRPRFPLATTLLLAAVAGACWYAVWRAERHDRRPPPRDEALAAFATEGIGDAPPPADGTTATASGPSGSVVR